MPYRIELSPNKRAGCKNTECKKAGIKFEKGECRFATQVTIDGHTSWMYKHWGCTTPQVIENLIEETGGDTEMVDGYDELPAEYQEKVQFALANGHVPDEDWKGDVECNRPGQKGFRVKAPKKKGKAAKAVADEEEPDVESPKPKKKRARAVKDDEEEEEAPAPKKTKGKPKKAAKESPGSEAEAKPIVKRTAKGKKAAVTDEIDEDDEEADEPEPPKSKRSRKKATATNGEEKPAPQKRGRKKKAAADE